MIVLGVLAGIDGAAGSSGREKARSVAGTLAEQDQERMRGMRAVDLSNYAYNRDVTVGTATYNVDSESDWIRDNTGGTVSCTNSSAQADYLRIRTTVTSSTVGKRTAPVQIDSLVAPPVGAVGTNQGTLAVQVNDRDAVGVPRRARPDHQGRARDVARSRTRSAARSSPTSRSAATTSRSSRPAR